MIYSVWNQGTRQFDYYEDGRQNHKANTPSPSHLSMMHEIGVPVDQAGWPLPALSRKVGRGAAPHGRVARRGSAIAGLGSVDFKSPGTIAVLLGIAALIYWKS